MRSFAPLLALLVLAPAAAQDAPAPKADVSATLNIRQGGRPGADGTLSGGTWKQVDRFEVPANHTPHDGLIAFEGPGWESDRVAYRLYLDERNVPDIYGKRRPGRILDRIGMGVDDYHTLADWGMDIFQVDQSLGMGGIGVLRDGKATQLGRSHITTRIEREPHTGTQFASLLVRNRDFAGAGGRPATLTTRYSIAQGSRITNVTAYLTGALPPMVAGLTKHPGVTVLQSPPIGDWRYIATYGVQSLAKDRLGIVLFYPSSNVTAIGDDGRTLFVRFDNLSDIRYRFAAAWEQEPDAPKDLESFRKWLDEQLVAFNRSQPLGFPVPMDP